MKTGSKARALLVARKKESISFSFGLKIYDQTGFREKIPQAKLSYNLNIEKGS